MSIQALAQGESGFVNSSGFGSNYFIKNDGSLWGNGGSYVGNGKGYRDPQATPVKILDNVRSVSGGSSYNAVAVKTDDTLWGWGSFDAYPFGSSEVDPTELYPTQMDIDDVKTAAVTTYYVVALKNDKSLWVCGDLPVGDGSLTHADGSGGFVKVAEDVLTMHAADGTLFYVTSDNTLWGYNYEGKSISSEQVPYYVTDNVASVTVGERHASIVKKDYTLWTMGGNYRYGLGTNSDETWYTPLTLISDGIMDAPADWATEEVELAIGEKLIPDDMQNNYTSPVTREEFCILAIRMIEVRSGMTIDAYLDAVGTEIAASDTFEDCDTKEVLAAKALGITDGTSETTFTPDRLLTRQEAAKFLTTTAVACGRDVTLSTPAYADKEEIASWAQPYTGYVYDINVMKGVGGNMFNPTGGYQRQQAFMTMYRIWKAIDAVNPDNVDLPEGEAFY